MESPRTLTPDVSGPTRDNLRRLVLLRYVVLAGLVGGLATARWWLELAVPWTGTLGAVGLLLALNLYTHAHLRSPVPPTVRAFGANLASEVLLLAAITYFTGGSANPQVSLMLLPIVVAATVLPRLQTWAVAGLAIACYTVLMFWYEPLTQTPMGPMHGDHLHHGALTDDFGAHLLGMWLTFVLSAALVAHFVGSMAESLRERDRQLAAVKEEALRNERIVALGTLAAGAAHELGTPLATMQLVADELEQRAVHEPVLREDVADLQEQLAACKRIITDMAASAGSARSEGGELVAADRLIAEVIDKWQVVRPQAAYRSAWRGSRPARRVFADATLAQALMNLLNNAADACSEAVVVEGRDEGKDVVIEVRDRGPGLSPEALARAGEPFFSTKGEGKGMGIGLFLASSTVTRLGGRIRVFNREGGGACTEVRLPAVG